MTTVDSHTLVGCDGRYDMVRLMGVLGETSNGQGSGTQESSTDVDTGKVCAWTPSMITS